MRFIPVLLLIVVFAAACDNRILVREYCDTEMQYSIRQSPGSNRYDLRLNIGRVSALACKLEPRTREVSLSAKTSTVEEALRLINQHRDEYRKKKSSGNQP